MALTYEFLIARADEADAEADKATLENVRIKAERSAAAWRDMAARTKAIETNREARAVEKEREREAEAARNA